MHTTIPIHNTHWPCYKYWDQLDVVRVTGLSQCDHFLRPNIELSADPTKINYYVKLTSNGLHYTHWPHHKY